MIISELKSWRISLLFNFISFQISDSQCSTNLQPLRFCRALDGRARVSMNLSLSVDFEQRPASGSDNYIPSLRKRVVEVLEKGSLHKSSYCPYHLERAVTTVPFVFVLNLLIKNQYLSSALAVNHSQYVDAKIKMIYHESGT